MNGTATAELESGKELDDLVDERVLGRRHHDLQPSESNVAFLVCRRCGMEFWRQWWPSGVLERKWCGEQSQSPNYSSDVGTAFELLCRLPQLRQFALTWVGDNWAVVLNDVTVEAPNVPLAICRAVLKLQDLTNNDANPEIESPEHRSV
jgi:hypothetical protein